VLGRDVGHRLAQETQLGAGVVATSSCACSISPIACPPVTDFTWSRKPGGISRETDLVSASTRKYSSSMPNLKSPDMVHLSRANVVTGCMRPFNACSQNGGQIRPQ
jgi:hypothetical protein